jgi:hypothetical protein
VNDKMTSLATPLLRLPLQVAPVDRTLVAASSLSGDGGVVASQGWQQALQTGLQLLPQILSLF